MNYWSNIEISPQDSEIVEINKFEKTFGGISENVQKIRELIRRFEVCHFKYQEHLKHLKDSILTLSPSIEPNSIGVNHVSKGKAAVENDKTGRSRLGLQYICSLKNWLGDDLQERSECLSVAINLQIENWLSEKNKDKERLVRLLVSRLMWDWKSYEEYGQGGKCKELEFQVCRIDICHYAFPKHIDLLLQGIGRLEPIDNFEGCGAYSTEIKSYVEEQFLILCDYLKSYDNYNSDKNEKVKIWLIASLAKTLKEQVGLIEVLPPLNKH